MRRGDFSELLGPEQRLLQRAAVDPRPADRPAVPGQHHPDQPAVAERRGDHERCIRCRRPASGRARTTLIQTSDNPQDQRKDNIRLDYRLNDEQPAHLPLLAVNWVGDLTPSAATSRSRAPTGDRPNSTQTASWTSTIKQQPDQRAQPTRYSRDDVFINVFTETGLYKRSRTGINYPYIFPDSKEIEDKIPTVTGSTTFTGIDGGPYPASSAGPIHTSSNVDDLRARPPHVQGRRVRRVLGRGRLRPDQRQRDSGRHQQPERPVRVPRRPRRRHRPRHRQHGAGPVQQLRRARPARLHQVARARDRPVHPGFLEADRQPDGRRRRPLRLLAAVVLDDQQHRQLRSAVLRPGQRGGRSIRSTGRLVERPPLQRHRPAGRRVRGRRATTSTSRRTRRCRRCSAASRAASRRRTTTSSSRASASATRSNEQDGRRAPAPASSTTASR